MAVPCPTMFECCQVIELSQGHCLTMGAKMLENQFQGTKLDPEKVVMITSNVLARRKKML